jgi:dTDP-4-dehydrorhamnose 3,5-epimerase
MKVTSLKIPDVKLIEPDVFEDERGFFYESFNQQKFNEAIGQDITFVQDNHSKSKKSVLRGLHYQDEPFAQGKLVRVIFGEVFDVAVDIRKKSSTYGQWVSEILSSENKKQLWIPKTFAHGFFVLSDYAEIIYKTDSYYSKKNERILYWDDPNISIDWPFENKKELIVSKKDQNGLSLNEINI